MFVVVCTNKLKSKCPSFNLNCITVLVVVAVVVAATVVVGIDGFEILSTDVV